MTNIVILFDTAINSNKKNIFLLIKYKYICPSISLDFIWNLSYQTYDIYDIYDISDIPFVFLNDYFQDSALNPFI